LGEIQEGRKESSAEHRCGINREESCRGRVTCKEQEEALLERRNTRQDRGRSKSPVGEGAEGDKEGRFGKGCKEVCSN
jgi:hypothetical protein